MLKKVVVLACGRGAELMIEVSKNDELCIQTEEFCIKNEGFCIKNDEFCSRCGLKLRGWPCCLRPAGLRRAF